MVKVKKVIVRREEAIGTITRLLEEYSSVRISLPDSALGKKVGLKPDQAIIRFWERRKEP